jgi:hypothetical protein
MWLVATETIGIFEKFCIEWGAAFGITNARSRKSERDPPDLILRAGESGPTPDMTGRRGGRGRPVDPWHEHRR